MIKEVLAHKVIDEIQLKHLYLAYHINRKGVIYLIYDTDYYHTENSYKFYMRNPYYKYGNSC